MDKVNEFILDLTAISNRSEVVRHSAYVLARILCPQHTLMDILPESWRSPDTGKEHVGITHPHYTRFPLDYEPQQSQTAARHRSPPGVSIQCPHTSGLFLGIVATHQNIVSRLRGDIDTQRSHKTLNPVKRVPRTERRADTPIQMMFIACDCEQRKK